MLTDGDMLGETLNDIEGDNDREILADSEGLILTEGDTLGEILTDIEGLRLADRLGEIEGLIETEGTHTRRQACTQTWA